MNSPNTPTKRPTGKEVFDIWVQLTKQHEQVGKLLLEVLAHPDMTLDMITAHAAQFRETRAHLRRTQRHTATLLEKKGMHHLARTVLGWRP